MVALRIAQVASRSGVPATTLRYYDQLGLVPSGRAGNGYRMYSEEVFDRLRFIDAARTLDLPLDDIGSLLRTWESDSCASVKGRLRPLIESHLDKVSDAIDGLEDLHGQLESARAHLDELPDRGDRCDPDCAFLMTETEPVACDLGESRSSQITRWRSLLAGRPPTPITSGVRYRLPIAELTNTADLAAAEQRCCPFFSFEISLQHDTFTLTMRTPVEGRPMLDELTGVDSDETVASRTR